MSIKVELPALGESIIEGTVSRWLVKVGDRVEQDQPIVEVTTDKVDAEIPAPAAGIVEALDLDAAQHLGGPNWALSFDTSGSVGGIDFDDEDVLEYDGTTWTVLYDGSAEDADWAAADLDAVTLPEPGFLLLLTSGLSALMPLRKLRCR